MSLRACLLRCWLFPFAASVGCQFDDSRVPVEQPARTCAEEIRDLVPRTLLTGTKLTKLFAAAGYDGSIYASHFDEEGDRVLKVVTDSSTDACQEEPLQGAARGLRVCLTVHSSPALSLVPAPSGMQTVLAEPQPLPTPLYIRAPLSNLLAFSDFPQSMDIDADSTARFVQTTIDDTPSVAAATLPKGQVSYTRQYKNAISARPGLVVTPGDLPWVFLGSTSAVFRGARGTWDLLCRPIPGPIFVEVELEADCMIFPFSFQAAVAEGPWVHAVGTRLLEGDQQAITYLSLSQALVAEQDEAWLADRVELVSAAPLGALADPAPAVSIGPQGPVVVYRAGNQIVINHRVDDSWRAHELPAVNPGPPQPVHDRDGRLHVFYLADENADGKSEQLKHLRVPHCVY